MPTFKIRRTWSETYYYRDEIEVEADNQEEALESAYEEALNSDDGAYDSSYDDNSLDCTILKSPKTKKTVTRNLPKWF